jgi:hypothetical protein
LQVLERLSRQVEHAIVAVVAEADRRGVWAIDGHRSVRGWCQATVNWSGAETTHRIGTVRVLSDVRGLADALASGKVGVAGNGTPVTRAACHVGTDMTTCYGLQADNTGLIATVSTDGTVTPIGTPPPGTSTLGCAGSPASSSDPLQDGTPFSDPQGSYEIAVDRDWDPAHGTIVAEVEFWFVAEPDDAFAPNVNVLTQAVPGMDLQGYLDGCCTSSRRSLSATEPRLSRPSRRPTRPSTSFDAGLSPTCSHFSRPRRFRRRATDLVVGVEHPLLGGALPR